MLTCLGVLVCYFVVVVYLGALELASFCCVFVCRN